MPSRSFVRRRRSRRAGMPDRAAAPGPRRVLVTGAGSGLGAALVRAYLAAGDRVLATDLAEQPGDPSASAGGSCTGPAAYRRLDVRSDGDWAEAIAWVEQQWGGLDLLVNNAGVAAGGRFDRIPLSEWEWLLETNLMGVVRGCRAAVPLFARQGRGCLVNIASIAGLCHAPGMATYNVSKAGVVALSETLAHELAPRGIQVSVACPYFFRSNLADSLPGSDPELAEAGATLIRGARGSAEAVAARVVAGVDAGEQLILTDAMGRALHGAKRFARPAYGLALSRLGRRLPG